jgi:hypothetical protein
LRNLLLRLDAQVTLLVLLALVGLAFPPAVFVAIFGAFLLVLQELRRLRDQLRLRDLLDGRAQPPADE